MSAQELKTYIEQKSPARSTRERAVKRLALDALDGTKDTPCAVERLRARPAPDGRTVAKMMLAPSVYRRSNQGRGDSYRGKTWAQHFDDMQQDALRLIGRAEYGLRYGA